MSIKYTNIFHFKPSKIYPNRDFWFENDIPSGSPAARNFERKTFKNEENFCLIVQLRDRLAFAL
jgi:hypothetical protein